MNVESNPKITEKYLFDHKWTPEFLEQLRRSRAERFPEYDRLNTEGSFIERFQSVIKGCEWDINLSERFVYFLDMDYVFDNNRGVVFDNISVDYRRMIDNGLYALKYSPDQCTNDFCNDYNAVIDGIVLLANRIAKRLGDDHRAEWFVGIAKRPANSFEEALQRILLLNQLLWQTNHPLMGFGLLDTVLADIYEAEKARGTIDRETATGMIVDFYKTLHRYFWFKSHALLGDTGQLVIVGRTDPNGNYVYNDLTFAFIDAIRIAQLPDPKVMLRVSKQTPDELLRCAVECIATGVGCPLFANDDIIIPKLIADGIGKKDAYAYATSACWEPLIAWSCPISNNLTVLNYMKSLENLFLREPLQEIDDFEMLLDRYFFYLSHNVNAAMNSLKKRRFAYDPLVSVFIGGCYEKKKDVSAGGATYNDYGMTTVAISNVVNSLINIKKYVFEEKICSLNEIKTMLLSDFEGNENWIDILKSNPKHYGMTDETVREITNRIVEKTGEFSKDFRNYLGGKLKFGLSSPAYIDAARDTLASFDGRKKGEPFHVHISTTDGEAYTELVNFASSIRLIGNSYNGNVVDFITSPSFISSQQEKFVQFVKGSIEKGFFEMQVGVLSSEMLIKAKKRPDDFPNIIVRVWGFSTFFKDLPDEYKDVVIQRALNNEKKTA